ncbi:MAG: hypothetical protein K0M50_05060 [Prolixibacteraceae bacterium]|nr:hypothetical protein [Prolixibacteraceae bacterium]
MKKIHLSSRACILIAGIALFTVMFSSCKKDEAVEGDYVIRFKANGTPVEFSVQASLVAAFGKSGTQHNASFSGGDTNSNISLQVFDNKEIATATFSGYTLSGNTFVGALIGYSDKTGTLYTQGSVNPNATITITEINAGAVRGTFSGTLKASGKPDIVLTQGEFFVWRAN